MLIRLFVLFLLGIGVGLLTTSGGDFQVGDALCLGSATLFGFHKILVEKYCRQIDDGVAFTGVRRNLPKTSGVPETPNSENPIFTCAICGRMFRAYRSYTCVLMCVLM
jgi:hypothetical protein